MRTLGQILKTFFKAKKLQYWICVPGSFKTKHDKELFIMDTIQLLQNKIDVIDLDEIS